MKKKSASGWTTSSFDISRMAYGLGITKAYGNQKDTAEFRVNDPDELYTITPPVLEYGDLVEIYMKADSNSFTDDDLLFEGVIRSSPAEFDSGSRTLSVKMNDFFEECFDVMIPMGYQQKKWFEMLQDSMNRWDFSDRGLYWANSANGWTGGDNPTITSSGTDFPLKDFASDYMPFYQIVEKLTSNEFTNDGQYLYYVGTEGGKRFLVIKNKQESSEISTLKEGTDTRRISVDKAKDQVKNYIIFYCGRDLAGNILRSVYFDLDSISKNGYKYYYMTEETANLASEVIYREAVYDEYVGGGKFNMSGFKWTSEDHYPTSFPYTWQYWADNTGAYLTSTSKSDFDDDFKTICLLLGAAAAKKVADMTKIPAYDVKFVYPFRNDLVLGGLYRVQVPSRGLDRLLRIKQLNFDINSTEVTFEEDETRRTL